MSGLNFQRWAQLWPAATPAAALADGFQQLAARYAEPHRHYHNQSHIADCLAGFDRVKGQVSEPPAVELAIWFHDAVYDPRAADNEERSAALAQHWLPALHASRGLADAVGQLVLATKQHDGSLHPDAPWLVDVDLSILGQPPERFGEYERQIREEYAWVDATVFAVKRAEILQRFLARPRIYQTDFFQQALETQARINLHESVRRLRAGG